MTKKNAISEFHFIMKYIAKLFIHENEKNFIGIVYLKVIIIMEKEVFINKKKGINKLLGYHISIIA